MKKKTGILLINLGTPDSPSTSDVRKYLLQFLLDNRVIDYSWILRNLLVRGLIVPFRASASAKLYKKLWTDEGSPLKVYGQQVATQLQNKVGNKAKVILGMRYQNPSIESALDELKKENFNRIVVFPMFPQYASASTGSAHEEVLRIVSKWQVIPELHFINSYHDNVGMIEVFADNARKMNPDNYEHFVFSFHGLPQSQLVRADHNQVCLKSADCCQSISEKNCMCYSAQCHSTARNIAERLNLDKEKYTISFQSRLGPEKWTQPPTDKILENLAKDGIKRVMVFSPAFVADCLETTVEIEDEYRQEFLDKGGEKLDLVPSLNNDPRWVQAIQDMVSPFI